MRLEFSFSMEHKNVGLWLLVIKNYWLLHIGCWLLFLVKFRSFFFGKIKVMYLKLYSKHLQVRGLVLDLLDFFSGHRKFNHKNMQMY